MSSVFLQRQLYGRTLFKQMWNLLIPLKCSHRHNISKKVRCNKISMKYHIGNRHKNPVLRYDRYNAWSLSFDTWLMCVFVYTPRYVTKMQLDVEESTPASDVTYWFHSRIAIGNWEMGPTKKFSSLNLNLGEVTHYFLVWILVKRQTDGQTDRKRCIWAHRAYTQVCSKTTDSPYIKWQWPCIIHLPQRISRRVM